MEFIYFGTPMMVVGATGIYPAFSTTFIMKTYSFWGLGLNTHSYQWWSLETWSRGDPFLRVSVSKVSSLVSVSVLKATGLETLNIANKCYSKFSIYQKFLFLVFAGKKHPKQVGKMPEIW